MFELTFDEEQDSSRNFLTRRCVLPSDTWGQGHEVSCLHKQLWYQDQLDLLQHWWPLELNLRKPPHPRGHQWYHELSASLPKLSPSSLSSPTVGSCCSSSSSQGCWCILCSDDTSWRLQPASPFRRSHRESCSPYHPRWSSSIVASWSNAVPCRCWPLLALESSPCEFSWRAFQ